MNSLQITRKLNRLVMAGIAFMSFVAVTNAQVKTDSTTIHEPATKTVSVDRGEVVYASGSDLVLKKDDGTVVHFANVSDTATVDGKQVAIDDLEPGMKLERAITITTTPHTVTTVQTVTGKVWHVNPPRFVILTLEDGTNHKFDLPNDHKVLVEWAARGRLGAEEGNENLSDEGDRSSGHRGCAADQADWDRAGADYAGSQRTSLLHVLRDRDRATHSSGGDSPVAA
jgi:hypothetical protein